MWKAKVYAIYCIGSFPSFTWDLTLDRNLIFYYFSGLTAIVANTNAPTYARWEQILAISMIVLEE